MVDIAEMTRLGQIGFGAQGAVGANGAGGATIITQLLPFLKTAPKSALETLSSDGYLSAQKVVDAFGFFRQSAKWDAGIRALGNNTAAAGGGAGAGAAIGIAIGGSGAGGDSDISAPSSFASRISSSRSDDSFSIG